MADALRDLVAAGRDDDHPGLCHVSGGEELYASMARRATTTDLSPQEIHDYGMSVLTDELPAKWADIGSRAVGVTDRDELFVHLAADPAMKYSSADEILEEASAAVERALAAAPDWFERLPDAPVVVEAVPEHLAPDAELLADEMGLYSSDVTRLGMLSADAWRSVRLVVDTGMHALGWTRTEALDFMVTHTPLDRDEAAVEIDRYIGMPGQALSYKVGQRELRRLREQAEQRLGPDFDVRHFHTVVLEHGGIPLGLLADLVDSWVEQHDS